jgi:hypothetical protein
MCSMFEYKLVHQEHQCVICFMHKINRRKVKGVVDWAAQHAPYIALWNVRIRQHYLHGARHRSGPKRRLGMKATVDAVLGGD